MQLHDAVADAGSYPAVNTTVVAVCNAALAPFSALILLRSSSALARFLQPDALASCPAQHLAFSLSLSA